MTHHPLRSAAAALVLTAVGGTPLQAQSASAGNMALPPILDRVEEVALARSAAPDGVAREATVLVLERGRGYVEAERGSNGVTCMVDRTWQQSVEPQCFDPEASATILPLRLRHAELREKGATREEVERDREEGMRDGRFRAPARPALTWMMSAGQVLYNDEGQHVGAWRPHVMIYYPGLTAEGLGLAGEAHPDGPWLSDAGEPMATLVIPMPAFLPVRESPRSP